jgi:glycosyltransferase involved in cell wall biosynthesis
VREETIPVGNERSALNGHANVSHRSSKNGHAKEPALDRPRISVIVPALNEERLIESTLKAFPPDLRTRLGIELIVSDGGSTDRTVELARRSADVVVRHTEPRRQTIAEGRNCGAAKARGDLLVFINADTIPRNRTKFIERLAAIAAEFSKPGGFAAYACPVEIAPAERRFSDRLFHTFFNNYVRVLNAVGLGMGRGECQVVRRDAFQAVGGYQNHMAAGEDFDLYTRLAHHGKIGYAAELCVYESPRRFRRFGYLRVLLEWSMNGLAVMILRRSISKEWEQVR